MMPHYSNRWTVGEWTFYEVEDHGFRAYENEPLYVFGPADDSVAKSLSDTYFASLEHAMASAIAEKHLGKVGAGGTAVGSAADWFMKMIGINDLKPAGENGVTALLNAVEASDGFPAVGERDFAARIVEKLETRGYVLARKP